MRIRVTITDGKIIRAVYPKCPGCQEPIKPDEEIEIAEGKPWHVITVLGKNVSCYPVALTRKTRGSSLFMPKRDPETGLFEDLLVRSDEKHSIIKPCYCGGVMRMRITNPEIGKVQIEFVCMGGHEPEFGAFPGPCGYTYTTKLLPADVALEALVGSLL